MLTVVLLPELAAGGDELRLPDLEAARLDATEDLARKATLYRVGLDQDEAALEGHRQPLPLRRARRVPSAGGAPGTAGSIGVSQYGHTCQMGSSGEPQLTHACLSFVVQTGQTR